MRYKRLQINSRCVCVFSCLMPGVCQSKTASGDGRCIAGEYRECQSPLAASVPSSWPWNPIWTLMKRLSMPRAPTKTRLCLFINHSTLAAVEWTWGFYLWVNLRAKSNLSMAHLHSSHIKCDVVETDNSISLFSRSLQSLKGSMGRWVFLFSCNSEATRGKQQFN